MQKALIGLAAVTLLIVGAVYFFGRTAPVPAPTEGSASGPDVSFKTYFHQGVEIGGNVLATTSQGAVTYTASQVRDNKLIEHIASGALTATLPTAASLLSAGFLKYPGDTYTLFIHASTTAITIAGNTGLSLQAASTTKQIPAGVTGAIHFTRLPATEGARIDALLIAD